MPMSITLLVLIIQIFTFLKNVNLGIRALIFLRPKFIDRVPSKS